MPRRQPCAMLVLHAGVMRRPLLLLPEALPAEAAHAGHQCSVCAYSYGADPPRAARVEPPQLSLHHACTAAFGVLQIEMRQHIETVEHGRNLQICKK